MGEAVPVRGTTVRDYFEALDDCDYAQALVIAEYQQIAAREDGEADIGRIWAILAAHATALQCGGTLHTLQ